MGRRAVAATLVSVIFFSTLLLANAAIYAAGGTYLSSAVLLSAQQKESGYATVLLGLSAFNSLSSAESYLREEPIGCSSAPSYLGSMGGSTSTSGDDQGVDFTTSSAWSYAASGAPSDNLTSMGVFDGYSAGGLNLLLTTKVDETLLGGLPSYTLEQQHFVHLPIDPEALVSLCLSALAQMHKSFSSLQSCDSSSVQDALAVLGRSYAGLGSVDMGGSARISGGVCSVDYWVTIAQTYEGVSGPSGWSVFGAQTIST